MCRDFFHATAGVNAERRFFEDIALREGARLVVEYDVKTNALGRDATGAPTTLAANALTLRGQVTF